MPYLFAVCVLLLGQAFPSLLNLLDMQSESGTTHYCKKWSALSTLPSCDLALPLACELLFCLLLFWTGPEGSSPRCQQLLVKAPSDPVWVSTFCFLFRAILTWQQPEQRGWTRRCYSLQQPSVAIKFAQWDAVGPAVTISTILIVYSTCTIFSPCLPHVAFSSGFSPSRCFYKRK